MILFRILQKNMNNDIVPVQVKGKQSDLQYTLTLETRAEAIDCFNRASKRLLNPKVWHELCGALSASFVLTGAHGEIVTRLAQVNDYLRIEIPAPGSAAGDGYDWVRIEAIDDKTDNNAEQEHFAITVRPCTMPGGATGGDTAHFFEHSATSSFVVERKQNTVTAYYYGRNEVPNTDTERTMDNVRNALVATGGFAGLSEAQWYGLIKGLLQEEIGG